MNDTSGHMAGKNVITLLISVEVDLCLSFAGMQKIGALCVFGISVHRWRAGFAAEIESCQSIDRQNCCDGARFWETVRFQIRELTELGRILPEMFLESLLKEDAFISS